MTTGIAGNFHFFYGAPRVFPTSFTTAPAGTISGIASDIVGTTLRSWSARSYQYALHSRIALTNNDISFVMIAIGRWK